MGKTREISLILTQAKISLGQKYQKPGIYAQKEQICNQFVAEAKNEKLPGAKRQAIAAIAKRNAILTLHSKLTIMKAQRHYR